jgi:hypothetical protein
MVTRQEIGKTPSWPIWRYRLVFTGENEQNIWKIFSKYPYLIPSTVSVGTCSA